MSSNQRSQKHKLLYWLTFVLVIAGIPTFILHFGLTKFVEKTNIQQLKIIRQKINADFRDIQQISNAEFFWATLFQDITKQMQANPNAKLLRDLRDHYENLFDYIQWDNNRNFVDFSISPKSFHGDWKAFIRGLTISFDKRLSGTRKRRMITEKDIINSRKLFGSQFILKDVRACMSFEAPGLLWPDSKNKKPLLWMYSNDKFGFVIFIKHSLLENNIAIKKAILKQNKQYRQYKLNLIDNNKIKFAPYISVLENLKQKITKVKNIPNNVIETPFHYCFPRHIKQNIFVTAVIEKSSIKNQAALSPSIITLIFFLFLSPIYYISFKTIVYGKSSRISVSWKLGLLFLLANGFPLSVIMFIGYDYLAEKQFSLFDEAYATSLEYLQNFDERIMSERANKILRIKLAEKKLLPKLNKKELTPDIFSKFIANCDGNSFNYHAMRVILIASDSSMLATRRGIHRKNKVLQLKCKYHSQDELNKRMKEFYLNMAKYFLATLNGKSIDMKTSTEVEILTEAATQQPLTSFLQNLLAMKGQIDLFKMKDRKQDTFIDVLSASPNGQLDYLLLIIWEELAIQLDYLFHQIENINRNPSNIKFLAIGRKEAIHFPRSIKKIDKSILKFASTLTLKPSGPRSFVRIQGKRYLIVGLQGTFVNDFNLLAIYPTEKVEKLITKQKKNLLFIGIMSLLLSTTLGLLLSHSILFPISALMRGTKAIEQRQFNYRLPWLGNDEFGKMATIFNDSMVDLDELRVAGFVQENLTPDKEIETGRFSLFGESIPMGDLGGDYYDYFTTGDSTFAILIGDVAGHGVGAALIMAMAKAGILHFDEILNRPLEIINRLHQLILASKTKKQRKIMTFQYMSLDANSGKALLANAGGCSPYYYTAKDKSVKELTLKGPALGTFKKAKFGEIELNFAIGDAIVFYTDGIVEARNNQGQEFTYERMLETVRTKYNINAQTFYDGIKQEYLTHLGDGLPDDDLTLIVLVFTDNVASNITT